MPKVDGSFSTFDEPQDGQATDALLPNISFSNFVRHFLHRNSKIGIAARSLAESYSSSLGPSVFRCFTTPSPHCLIPHCPTAQC